MKTSGSYKSISRGVSQQAANQRLDGQHEEQVNMLSDPVVGVSRRRGSKFVTEQVAGYGATTPEQWSWVRGHRTRDFTISAGRYTLLYPTTYLDPADSRMQTPLKMFNKATGQFMQVVYDEFAQGAVRTGLSGVAQAGQYLVLAIKDYIGGGQAQYPAWESEWNKSFGTWWVRGGTYSRTFMVEYTIAGVRYQAAYITPQATYPGVLDTTDIPQNIPDPANPGQTIPNPDYTKLVNDRVNAYNSAVTQWIATAGAAIQPPAIALKLKEAIQIVTPWLDCTVIGPYIMITNNALQDMGGTDGGDNTWLRVTYLETSAVDQLSSHHTAGKIVKVRANDGDEPYYMKARGMTGLAPGSWGPCVWEEAAGESFQPALLFGHIGIADNVAYVAVTPGNLRAMHPAFADFPDYSPRAVGDSETSPIPYFMGKQVDYLGTFQDRLVVGSGPVLSMSEPGNYFNWFRQSSFTVKDNDPVEVFAVGSEDDTVRESALFDKSLILFGDRQQYAVDGRNPVTPSTTVVIQSSAHEDAVDARPVSNGGLVFFGKNREGHSKVYQIEIGDVQDTSRASEITLQLSDYIKGRPVELLGTTSPDMILVRSSEARNSVYTFRYVDTGRERVLDSWSRWDYSPNLGEVIGMSTDKDQVLLFSYMETEGATGVAGYYTVNKQSLLASVGDTPYLDSQRPYTELGSGTSARSLWNQSWISCAVNKGSKRYLQGATPATAGNPGNSDFNAGLISLQQDFPELTSASLTAGVTFDSYVTLTSPFRRDWQDVVVVTGRLTVGRVDVSFRDTAGFTGYVNTRTGSKQVVNFNGRILGTSTSTVTVPLTTASRPVFIGKESREYTLTLKALDWKPFTITSIEWTGQYFTDTNR